jgi:hypothetical protein
MATIRASEPGLLQVDRARRKKGWLKQAEMWCQMAQTSRATLKRFWRREAIDQCTFIAICSAVGIADWEPLAAVTDTSQILELSTMPDVSVFFGRATELRQLTAWSQQCRLIALWGIGGIGKTALVAEWIEASLRSGTGAAQFQTVIWRSLQTPGTVQGITEQLGKISPAADLLTMLQQQRILLILDNWEALLGGSSAGQVKPEFQEFSQLLQQLGTIRHQSCILVISREKPSELTLLEGIHPAIKSLKLEGLGTDAIALLEHRQLHPEPGAWQTLIQLYRGHPLALNMIAGLIQEICQGSATAFLKMNTIVVHQLDNVLAERMRYLSPLELEILKILAQQSQAVSKEWLHEQLPQLSQSQLLEILLSLERRSLLEILSETAVLFALAPIIQKYIRQKNP